MIWPVTLTCGFVGLAVAHIPGALLGVLIGSIIDYKLAIKSWFELRVRLRLWAKPALAADQVLFMLLGHLAKSTGRVTSEHIQVAQLEMQRLQLNAAARRAAIAAFSHGKECLVSDLRNSLAAHYSTQTQLEQLLLAGWRMARAQGLVTVKQRRSLQQCADWLGCSVATFASIEKQSLSGHFRPRTAPSELDAALQLLGVSRSASLVQVKKAYRRQISRNHPDKLMGAGAKPAQVQAATQRTSALHQAYALVRQHLEL